jgi:hypothetical protein
VCGNGLHFLLPGQNEPGKWYEDDVHLAIEVDPAIVVNLTGKSKASHAIVRFVGTHEELHAWLQKEGHTGPWYKGVVNVGDCNHAMVGDYGYAIAGKRGHATAGDSGVATVDAHGHAVAGDFGNATAGNCGYAKTGFAGTATAGRYGYAIAEVRGHAVAGEGGHAMAEKDGTATAGDFGNAIVGPRGTAIVGYGGHAKADYDGRAAAGVNGTITIACGMARTRKRYYIGYIGEDGLEPNKLYKLRHDLLCEQPNKSIFVPADRTGLES